MPDQNGTRYHSVVEYTNTALVYEAIDGRLVRAGVRRVARGGPPVISPQVLTGLCYFRF